MMSETKLDNLEENILNKKSQYTNIAGILLIMAGIIAVISWIPYITGDQLLYQAFLKNYTGDLTQEQVKELFSLCSSVGIILSIFPILGGVLTFKRKFWTIALFCSIISLFTIGGLFLSSILSLIGMILLFLNKKDFQQPKEPYS